MSIDIFEIWKQQKLNKTSNNTPQSKDPKPNNGSGGYAWRAGQKSGGLLNQTGHNPTQHNPVPHNQRPHTQPPAPSAAARRSMGGGQAFRRPGLLNTQSLQPKGTDVTGVTGDYSDYV